MHINPLINTDYKPVRFKDLKYGDMICRREPWTNKHGEVIDRSFMGGIYTVIDKTEAHLSIQHPNTHIFDTPFVLDFATYDDGKWSLAVPVKDEVVCAGMFQRAFAVDCESFNGWEIKASPYSTKVFFIFVPKSKLVQLNAIYLTWMDAAKKAQ